MFIVQNVASKQDTQTGEATDSAVESESDQTVAATEVSSDNY